MKKEVLVGIFLILIFIILFSSVNAGPYGYNDSMDLKYKVVNGKIIYGYGDGIKYITSLRPKNLTWKEWKPESRREIINLSWEEISNYSKLGQDKELPANNIIANLGNKIADFFLKLFKK